MIKFKPVTNRRRRELREEMQEAGLLDIDTSAPDFDLLKVEEAIVNILMPLVASWDFKSVETGEPIPLDAPDIYDLMTPQQSTELMTAIGEVTSGKIPPKSGGRSS